MKGELSPERGRYVDANTEQLISEQKEIGTGRQTVGERHNQIAGKKRGRQILMRADSERQNYKRL